MRIWATLAFLTAIGCSKGEPQRPPAPLGIPMPAEASIALRSDSEFQLFSLDPYNRDTDPKQNRFHHFVVLGSTDVSASDRHQIVEALIAGVAESDGSLALCFEPRHGIRVIHADKRYDFVICFECLQIYWYTGDDMNSTILTSGTPLEAFNRVLTEASVTLADPA